MMNRITRDNLKFFIFVKYFHGMIKITNDLKRSKEEFYSIARDIESRANIFKEQLADSNFNSSGIQSIWNSTSKLMQFYLTDNIRHALGERINKCLWLKLISGAQTKALECEY